MTSFNTDALNKLCGNELTALFNRDDITEIYVNDDGLIRYQSHSEGKVKSQIYVSPEKINTIIGYIAGQVGKIINSDVPSLSCEIGGYGFRFQAEVPPIVTHPQFNIRKKAIKIFTIEEYVKQGTLSSKYAVYLKNAIKERKNILVVGGTGTGKTTFLNALLHSMAEISPFHRIISLEDLPELQCPADDYSPMYTMQDTGKSGYLKYNMTRLLADCMRRSPDRIIVGEVRDGAAYTMLKAWNTGHPGGVCTVHANGAKAGLNRIKSLALEDPAHATDIENLIGDAIQVVVGINHVEGPDGRKSRKITEILEVNGFNKVTQDYEITVINS